MNKNRRDSGNRRHRGARGVLRWIVGVAIVFAAFAVAAGRQRAGPPRAPTAAPASSSAKRQKPERPPSGTPAEASPWSSPEACLGFIAAQPPKRQDGVVRVATWNVRWFPDGGPGNTARAGERGPVATNLEWLACALASLGADAVALQEIKGTPPARAAIDHVATRLGALTGGRWRVALDGCAGGGRQHVGVLYDETRLRRRESFDVIALNPRGPGGCDGSLRPGHAVYFERDGGADFHFIAVHMKSGGGRGDLDLRRATLLGLDRAYAEAEARVKDPDVVIAGDLNTMGCPKCRPKVTAEDELRVLDEMLASASPPFRRVAPSATCSEYYRGRASLLDHFLVQRGMREVRGEASVIVHGLCADLQCSAVDGEMPRAYRELSDHCPAVLALDDRDLDGP